MAVFGFPLPALTDKAEWALVGMGETKGGNLQERLRPFPGKTIWPASYEAVAGRPHHALLLEVT